MWLLLLLCGFYLFGLLIARGLTMPRQALVSGAAMTAAAGIASLTLWLVAKSGFIEPWMAVAMIGTVALPALMIGLGLLAGGWVRRSGASPLALMFAALPFAATLLIPFV